MDTDTAAGPVGGSVDRTSSRATMMFPLDIALLPSVTHLVVDEAHMFVARSTEPVPRALVMQRKDEKWPEEATAAKKLHLWRKPGMCVGCSVINWSNFSANRVLMAARSTVTATTGHPAASARLTSLTVTSGRVVV